MSEWCEILQLAGEKRVEMLCFKAEETVWGKVLIVPGGGEPGRRNTSQISVEYKPAVCTERRAASCVLMESPFITATPNPPLSPGGERHPAQVLVWLPGGLLVTLSGGTWSPVARTPQRGLARGQLRGHWCGKGSGVASLGGHVRGSSPLLVYKGCWCCC